MKLKVWMFLSACALTTTGCSCFFPKTGAHGVVLDQNNISVPHVSMRATWVQPSSLYPFMRPQFHQNFTAGADGQWRFCTRDADHLYIEARPPSGYEVFGHVREFTVGPINSGEYRTNVVLRLRKIEPPLQSKETK